MFSQRNALLRKRYKKAFIFKGFAMLSVVFCLGILLVFLLSIAKSAISPLISVEALYDKNLQEFINKNLHHKDLHHYFPRSIKYLPKNGTSQWYPIKHSFKQFIKEKNHVEGVAIMEDYITLYQYMVKNNKIRTHFNFKFFVNNNSIYPEIAGIKSAIVGSLFVLAVFIVITIPIGILVGMYISEFLPQGKRKSILQVNIQNLASVPSIIYGIIVLNICINFFGMTRSSALVGGVALSLLILPMIVMITYNAMSMVPQSYKDSSLALGLSNMQTTLVTTLPLAIGRIMTGVLLAIARAAGETAPLIIVGMAFFSSSTPSTITNDAVTTLPLQIYLWTSNPQEVFIEYASASILVFIIFLTSINLCVHFIRNRLSKV